MLGLSLAMTLGNPALNAGGWVLNPLSPVKSALQANQNDVNIVVEGDSTGLVGATTNFFYLWVEWLATLYPAYSFDYYPPNGSGGYGAPVSLQTGSGAQTFRLYNNSIGGAGPDSLLGSLFDTAFVAPGRAWDAVIWNHGKNISSFQTQPVVEGEYLGAVAQMQLSFPDAQHLFIDQYPNRDDSGMAICHAALLDIVDIAPGIGTIDFYTKSYVSGDYNDNVHLTAAANLSRLLPIMQAYWNSTRSGVWAPEATWLDTTSVNYLEFGGHTDCADFSLDGTSGSVPGAANAVPYRWTNSGTVAYSKEVGTTYDGAARSQKLQGSGAAQAAMYKDQTATAIAALKGQNVVLTAVQYVAPGSASSVGRFGLTPNGTGAGARNVRTSLGQGGWRVRCVGPIPIPADMTTCLAILYHDTAGTPDATHPVYYQWANLTIGKLPRSPA